jgi:hypothetical protein
MTWCLLGRVIRRSAVAAQRPSRFGDYSAKLLLVRHPRTGRVIVAGGFHRLCTVYTFDQTAMIPRKIV